MKCAEILLKLEDYSYGELTDLENSSVAAHLRNCLSCNSQYESILQENELLADYEPNLNTTYNLWTSIEERISQPITSVNTTNTTNTNTIDTIISSKETSVIRQRYITKNSFGVLENQSVWLGLSKELISSLSEFVTNPLRFFQDLFQDDILLTRDKRNWQLGKAIAIVLWFFSIFSYAKVFYQLPVSIEKSSELEKIVDLAPLTYPPQLIQKSKIEGKGNNSGEVFPLKRNTLLDIKQPVKPSKVTSSSNKILQLPSLSLDIPNNSTSNIAPILPSLSILNSVENLEGVENGIGSGQNSSGVGSGTGSGQTTNSTGYGSGSGSNAGSNDFIYSTNDVGVKPPRILYKEKPQYTEEARREKIEGTIVLSVVLNANNRVTNIKVIHGLGHGLDEEAIKAASQVKFIAATRNGIPINVETRIEYSFKLF